MVWGCLGGCVRGSVMQQCLNQVRGEFKPFKRRIESVFENIKMVTEASGNPQLGTTHRQWLLELTGEVLALLDSYTPSMLDKIAPVTRVLKMSKSYHC